MMRTLIPFFVGAALAAPVSAQAVHWPINGHWYEPVATPGGIDWSSATILTSVPGQHLATIADAAENAFVFGLVDVAGLWATEPSGENVGPWIGAGYVPSGPNGPNWFWSTGEPFLYTAWAAGEPNGGAPDLGGHYSATAPARAATWGDRAAIVASAPGYVIEYEFMLDRPVPGAAGGPNGFFTYWGSPGSTVVFLASLQVGFTAVPGCAGLGVNLNAPAVIGSGVTNAAGSASLTILIPPNLSGRSAFFQATERARCRVTNLVFEVL